jgi:hypothetical protein
MAGKLGGRGRLNAVVPGSLVHIVDQLSGRHYLVDTGASFHHHPGCVPPAQHDEFRREDVRLHHLQQGGSQERLSPDTHARK